MSEKTILCPASGVPETIEKCDICGIKTTCPMYLKTDPSIKPEIKTGTLGIFPGMEGFSLPPELGEMIGGYGDMLMKAAAQEKKDRDDMRQAVLRLTSLVDANLNHMRKMTDMIIQMEKEVNQLKAESASRKVIQL